MKRGHLIIIEGMDGAGKTTAITHASAYLQSKGHDVLPMSSWLSNPFSHLARQVVTDKGSEPHPIATLSAAIAAVNYSYYQYVTKQVESGKTVLLDRGPRASLALQVWPDKKLYPELLKMWQASFSNYAYDLELVFVTNHELAKERIAQRSGSLDRIESKSNTWHDLAREGYVFKKEKQDIIINDSSLEKLLSKVTMRLESYLDSRVAGYMLSDFSHI